MDFLSRFIYLLLALPAFVLAFTLHEFAHAYTAHRLGDDTAKNAGKMSLDPLKMLDPIGSGVLLLTILMGWPMLGWASVPVNRSNLKNPRVEDSLISVAGPISNVAQTLGWLIILLGVRVAATAAGHTFSETELASIVNAKPNLSSFWIEAATVCAIGVTLNLSLAAFNMLPIPPFDGGFIAQNLVPELKPAFDAIRPYSFMIIILLISSGRLLDPILRPVETFATDMVLRVLGENPGHWIEAPA